MRLSVALAWPVCFIGMILVVKHNVESVVVTGPILFTLGLLAAVGGAFTRDRLALSLGCAHCAICVLFFLLVNLLHWSPADARQPFIVMGWAYALAAAVPTASFFIRRSRTPL